MIILEGPDGAGKTTLLKTLQELYGFDVSPKAVSSQGVGYLGLQGYVEQNLETGFRPVLFDRFALISGQIYGSHTDMAEPNTPFANYEWVHRMEMKMLWLRPLIIYCLPPLDVVRENLRSDTDSQGVVGDRIGAIYWAYQSRCARDAGVGMAMRYDYTNPSNIMLVRARLELRRREPAV